MNYFRLSTSRPPTVERIIEDVDEPFAILLSAKGIRFSVSMPDLSIALSRHWSVATHKGVIKSIIHDHSGLALHNIILPPGPGLMVDHINGHANDNRRSNLRLATQAQNQMNRHRVKKSGAFRGVSLRSGADKWAAQVGPRNARKHLGYFQDDLSAAIAYDRAARELYGEFARPNFPWGTSVMPALTMEQING